MTKADELRARANRVSSRTPSRGEAGAGDQPTETPVRKPAPIRAAPVRITADLPPVIYRALIDYPSNTAATLGRAKIAHVQVVRALVAELADDADLQSRIADRVRQQLDS
jgi:hypothetical protein